MNHDNDIASSDTSPDELTRLLTERFPSKEVYLACTVIEFCELFNQVIEDYGIKGFWALHAYKVKLITAKP